MTNNIEQQAKDWKAIGEKIELLRTWDKRRVDTIQDLHEQVRVYFMTYHTKYDPFTEPK